MRVLQLQFKLKVNRLLGLFGFQISRLHALWDSDFYRTDPTCQIPYLGFLYESIFGQKISGTVVEVGAYDGQYLSNSSCLIEKGWQALLIEPVPHLAKACRIRYRDNSNVKIREIGIGSSTGVSEITYMDTMSSMSPTMTAQYKTKSWAQESIRSSEILTIEVDTLNNVLSEASISPNFEVLIVDVEGMESEVFDGFSLQNWKPRMLIVELSDFHPDLPIDREKAFRLYTMILETGYYVIYKDHINTIFVSKNNS